ncbi:hypothetical protein OH76DRAFT_1465730 [Lentinus brumalis]|uniref:GmrSD restriction endonucleases N-terminal domain-containing protein n=1 Tax=Lentinus brumalis TaxID=2498619 RepID=A0A371CZA6_9APHY|nr:hypothetical protein OH76DRAFT_1465730 [Polyporus brumalis]
MDYDEDYDQLYEDEENYNPDEFDLGPCLNAPAAQLYTTKQLHTLIHEGVIDLNPAYQREVVWPEAKQIKLLDSIWRNYYVPPIVFAVIRDEDGEEVRCCVDGKQRLTSIQKFFDGQIPYKHWRTGKSWWYTSSQAQKKARPEVPQWWKNDFASKTITCVEYHNLPQTQERDIFQRVQLGVALSAAEKLQAIPSPRTEWIIQLQTRFFTHEENLTQKMDIASKRGQDFQLIAGLVYCCDQYPEQAQPSSKNLERWLTSDAEPPRKFKETILDVFCALWHIATDGKLKYGFSDIKKRVAPAEFVFTGVVLYVLREASYEDRAQAIYDMRTHIRQKFSDVRMRRDIIKELWTFVDALADSVPVQETKPKKKGKERRARDDDDESMDDDYRPKKQSKKKK